MTPQGDAIDTGLYDPSAVDATYAEQLREARLLLESGHGVVLDASWTRDAHRRAARSLAGECRAGLTEVECFVDPGTADRRLLERSDVTSSQSDATVEVADVLRRRREPWPSATVLATDAAKGAVLGRAIDVVIGQRSRSDWSRSTS